MVRLKTCYIIELGYGNQAGDITEVKLSSKEYNTIRNTPSFTPKYYNGREIYSITDSYMSALYTTQN